MHVRSTLLAALVLASLLTPTGAEAGPPCVCWPIEVDDLPVIDVERRGGPAREIAATLLHSLDDELPVLARMENLRRASLALQGDEDTANYILARLQARVLDATTGKARSPEKLWFDAGYAVACFREAGQVTDLDGYRWITRAIRLSGANQKYEGGDGAMHYGAALSVLMPKRRDHAMFGHHLQQMKAAARSDPLLGKNFKGVAKRYPPLLKHFARSKE